MSRPYTRSPHALGTVDTVGVGPFLFGTRQCESFSKKNPHTAPSVAYVPVKSPCQGSSKPPKPRLLLNSAGGKGCFPFF